MSDVLAPTPFMAADDSDDSGVAEVAGARTRMGRPPIVPTVLIIAFVLVALLAPWITPFDPGEQSLRERLLPPFSEAAAGGTHILGTDSLGRDVLSRLIVGSRVSLGVGVVTVAVSGTIGVLLGMTAGYFGRWIDTVIMRSVDVMLGFPVLLLALFFLFAVGPSAGAVVTILAIIRWMVYARVTRALVREIRDLPYVAAARTLGCSRRRILFKHVLPNIAQPIIVLATVEIATVILAEAGLTFLGLGIQPPGSSWGLMISEGRSNVADAWWLVFFPGLAIMLVTGSINWVATSLRGREP